MGIEDSEASSNQGNSQNQQEVGSNPGQAINQMIGGMAIKIDQLTVYYSQKPPDSETPKTASRELGPNPYRGLEAFRETDGDRFFGREEQIKTLWEKFCYLYQDKSTVRVLSIYGPSGSGKSSLARAGLIPQLRKKTLPGCDRARLAVLVPGTHPLEALATVLARIATDDSTPVKKSQEFEDALRTKSNQGKYEGLRRIANNLLDIASSPLIILVDQFEEVYTYALLPDKTQRDAFIAERNAFIENLLCAAADRSQRVSVILTLRSDFLGETQQHPRLNKLFSDPHGFLVPVMQPEELAIAIAKPAEQEGYKLDTAIVQLLIEQTQGREGALPLLQFALSQIWDGLQNKVEPTETLQRIGGVGGAVAVKAQNLYQSLQPEEQAISRSIFLALVQVSENSGDTRRRAAVSEIIATDGDENRVWSVINRFAEPGVRFLVIFSDERHGEMIEMIEVAHEALIRNWGQLKEWLKECREALGKKRKIEQAADEWKYQRKSKDYLLQGRSLRDAREFTQAPNKEIVLSSFAVEFVKASQNNQRRSALKIIMLFIVFPIIGTLIILHFWFIHSAQIALRNKECEQDSRIGILLWYMLLTGHKHELRQINLCRQTIPRINLQGANLWKANLKMATLKDANFQRTFLVDANFQDADLESTDFQGALLKEANLQGADLMRAKLQAAKGLTRDQVSKAYLCQTELPDNINLDSNRDCQTRKVNNF